MQLTGRVEEKRRWSDGIHQAVEAKEGLKIQVHHIRISRTVNVHEKLQVWLFIIMIDIF